MCLEAIGGYAIRFAGVERVGRRITAVALLACKTDNWDKQCEEAQYSLTHVMRTSLFAAGSAMVGEERGLGMSVPSLIRRRFAFPTWALLRAGPVWEAQT